MLVSTCSGNGLSHVWRPIIIWIKAPYLPIVLVGTKGKNVKQTTKISFDENTFEDIIWKILAILFNTKKCGRISLHHSQAPKAAAPLKFGNDM